MWGIEFFDEAAKTRRSRKLSSKRNDSISSKKQEEKTDAIKEDQAPTSDSQSDPNTPPTGNDKTSVNPSPPSNQPAVSSEEAEPRSELTNVQTSEEKASEHVTVAAKEDDWTGRRHVTPNLRDDSIDDGYVIIGHKGSNEEGLSKPGILDIFWIFCYLHKSNIS